MTQKDKQLLLVDLCGRLPYGVMVRVEGEKYFNETKEPYITNLSLSNYVLDYNDVTIIPYLRPLLSMTEEEKAFLDATKEVEYTQTGLTEEGILTLESYDYLNSIHVDYRGLIEKGLALEAPEGMYKTE